MTSPHAVISSSLPVSIGKGGYQFPIFYFVQNVFLYTHTQAQTKTDFQLENLLK